MTDASAIGIGLLIGAYATLFYLAYRQHAEAMVVLAEVRRCNDEFGKAVQALKAGDLERAEWLAGMWHKRAEPEPAKSNVLPFPRVS